MRQLQNDREDVMPQVDRLHEVGNSHQALPRRLPHLCLRVSQQLGQRRQHDLLVAGTCAAMRNVDVMMTSRYRMVVIESRDAR